MQQRGVAMLGRKGTDMVREGRDDAWPWDVVSIRDPQAPWATLGNKSALGDVCSVSAFHSQAAGSGGRAARSVSMAES